MFNLNEKIAAWRKQMSADGIRTSAVLDELESHLHEEVEQQRRLGLSVQPAFEAAIQQLGQSRVLIQEFKKINETTERKSMKRNIIIFGGLFSMLFGYSMIMPLLGNLHRTGTLRSLTWLLCGIVLVVIGGITAFYAIRRFQARGLRWVNIGLIAVGAWYLIPASIVFINEKLSSTERIWATGLMAATVVFFASCLHLNQARPSRSACES
jgi:cation transport ATPase